MRDIPTLCWRLFGAVTFFFMLSPLLILVLFAFSDKSLLTFPIPGLTVDWFVKTFARPDFWVAFQNSMVIVVSVGVASTIIGSMVFG